MNDLSGSLNNTNKIIHFIVPKMRFFLEILIPLFLITYVLDLPLWFFRISLFGQQYIAFAWGAVTALIFLTLPVKKNYPKNNPQWYDLIAATLAFLIGVYLFLSIPAMILRMGIIYPLHVLIGIITFFIVLESVRRTSGWSVVLVILVFFVYAKWGYSLSGIFQTTPLSWTRMFQQIVFGSDFLLGPALRIACEIVFAFIFFGKIFLKLGAADFFMDICFVLVGKVRGGPAKIAVVSSSLFGSISGSAVANVVSTGMVTIPLMRQTGYKDYYAGAIEAVASTGGQIMPPVMGATAFVMAQFLGVSYAAIVAVAIVPALLYYLCLFVQIDGEAIKLKLGEVPEEYFKPLKDILKKGWIYIIPLIVLIWALFIAMQEPGVAALLSTGVAVLVSFARKETRSLWTLKYIGQLLKETSHGLFEIISIVAGAGFIIGLIAYSGLGLTFSDLLTSFAGGSLFFLGILTALACVVLGMGMPTTPAYIMLSALAAPALVRFGIAPIVAHLFIFYFGTLSMITPPVALSVFAAASITGANTSKIAYQAMKLGFAGYLIPFIFLYNPALVFVEGNITEQLAVIIFTTVAVFLVATVFQGYVVNNRLKIIERLILSLIILVLIYPNPGLINTTLLYMKIIGVVVTFLFLLSLVIKNRRFLKTKTA